MSSDILLESSVELKTKRDLIRFALKKLLKRTVHPQKILLKYVMLRTITIISTIIIVKYT